MAETSARDGIQDAFLEGDTTVGRDRRGTQFAFERLINETGAGDEGSMRVAPVEPVDTGGGAVHVAPAVSGEEPHEPTLIAPEGGRDRRATHFAFERLLEDSSGESPVHAVRVEDGAPKESTVHIEFKVRQMDGSLRTTDTLSVPYRIPLRLSEWQQST